MNEHKIYMAMTMCNSTERGKCKLCPYHTLPRCTERMLRDAKIIIVRKDAKVDELQRKNSELEIELTAMRGAANSYKSEVERLQAVKEAELDTIHNLGDDYERALEEINRLKEEVERLENENESFSCLGKMYSEIKSEAYKEFVERFKAKAEASTVVTPPDFEAKTTYKITERKLDHILLKLTEKAGKER